MRKLLLLSITALGCLQHACAQDPKNYRLTVVAEGNYGTPNGDIFNVFRQNGNPVVIEGPLYQNTNNISGIDVLQDYDVKGDKAVLCGKGTAATKFAVVNYPAMDTVFTVTSGLGAGLQRCGMASSHKAYIVQANSSQVKYVDIDNRTITNVTDPGGYFASGIHTMIGYNNAMYIANGTKVVKIDTATQTTTTVITPGITGITAMVKDTANGCFWLLGKSGTISSIVKIDVMNNDAVSAPVVLTGFTAAKLLRVGPGKLYFVSGTGFYVYDLNTQAIPVAPVYTVNLPGNTASIMYDRSFTVDPVSGDFAYTSANTFVAPTLFEIVSGSTYTRIDSGAITGAAIVNEIFDLHTWDNVPPVTGWDTTTLDPLYAQCDTTLTMSPTAMFGTNTVTATTDIRTFTSQGNYTITWKYVYGSDSITQVQYLTIEDTAAPVPDIVQLSPLSVSCPYMLIAPTATDNCQGAIVATTDSLTFTVAGTYTVVWTYTDNAGNVSTQEQQLEVNCGATGIKEHTFTSKVYPNPAKEYVLIEVPGRSSYTVALYNAFGHLVKKEQSVANQCRIQLANLPDGMYYLSIKDKQLLLHAQSLIVQH